jgi:hypothetical protein
MSSGRRIAKPASVSRRVPWWRESCVSNSGTTRRFAAWTGSSTHEAMYPRIRWRKTRRIYVPPHIVGSVIGHLVAMTVPALGPAARKQISIAWHWAEFLDQPTEFIGVVPRHNGARREHARCVPECLLYGRSPIGNDLFSRTNAFMPIASNVMAASPSLAQPPRCAHASTGWAPA